MVGIKLVRLEGVLYGGTDVMDEWVVEYDPEFSGGCGAVTSDRDPGNAMRFPTLLEAMAFYHQVSRTRPVRQDGEPNCPLTAYSVSFEWLPEDDDGG